MISAVSRRKLHQRLESEPLFCAATARITTFFFSVPGFVSNPMCFYEAMKRMSNLPKVNNGSKKIKNACPYAPSERGAGTTGKEQRVERRKAAGLGRDRAAACCGGRVLTQTKRRLSSLISNDFDAWNPLPKDDRSLIIIMIARSVLVRRESCPLPPLRMSVLPLFVD